MGLSRFSFFFLFIGSLSLVSCGDAGEPEVPTEDLGNVPFTRSGSLDTVLITIVESVNPCDWKAADRRVEPLRNQHSISTQQRYIGLHDSNLVVSIGSVEDLAHAKEFTNSDHDQAPLREVSKNAKVKHIFLKQKLEYTVETKDTLVFYMSFKTMDYARWEEAFLNDYRENPAHDFEVTHVFQNINEPDIVHMVFLANEPDYVEIMEKNMSFRMKMLAAGVISYPVTYKLLPAAS